MAGAIWKPLAPAPTSAKRVPRISRSSGQRAEWNEGPAKVSMPGISGSRGRFSEPTALITKRASSTSSAPIVGHCDTPLGCLLLPHHLGDSGLEAAVRPEVVLVDDRSK